MFVGYFSLQNTFRAIILHVRARHMQAPASPELRTWGLTWRASSAGLWRGSAAWPPAGSRAEAKGDTLQLKVAVTWGTCKAQRPQLEAKKAESGVVFLGRGSEPSSHHFGSLRSAVSFPSAWVPQAQSRRKFICMYCLAWKWSLVATALIFPCLKFSNCTLKSGGDMSPPSHTKLRLWQRPWLGGQGAKPLWSRKLFSPWASKWEEKFTPSQHFAICSVTDCKLSLNSHWENCYGIMRQCLRTLPPCSQKNYQRFCDDIRIHFGAGWGKIKIAPISPPPLHCDTIAHILMVYEQTADRKQTRLKRWRFMTNDNSPSNHENKQEMELSNWQGGLFINIFKNLLPRSLQDLLKYEYFL